jgi:hypothetical protein
LLALHRETVNRQVRLLKIHNRAEAPPGNSPEKPEPTREEPRGSGTAASGATGAILAIDFIGEEDAGEASSQLVQNAGQVAVNPRSQNQPGAPPGNPRHFHRRARRSQCGTVNTTGPWEEEIVPSSTAEPDKVPAKVNAGGPASDVIWDDTGVPVQP